MNDPMEQLKTFLQDEVLLRTPLIKYTVKDFLNARKLANALIKNGLQEKAIEELEQFLSQTHESVLTHFILLILKSSLQVEYENALEKLLNQFNSIRKSSIVTVIAEAILEYDESIIALNTLADHYRRENNEEELLEIWERILKQEKNNYKLPQKIAGIKLKNNKTEEAVRFLKMAFFRALEMKDNAEILKIWDKLIAHNNQDFSFFQQFSKKLSNLFNTEEMILIIKKLYNNYYKDYKKNTDYCLSLLKELIELDPENQDYRDDLITLYREKYKNHSHLEEFITYSGLQKKWKKIKPQIETFEKHIRFDNDTFVYHKSFGYGLIKSIEKDKGRESKSLNVTKLKIDFENKRNHFMTLRIAVNSLNICYKYNIKALKIFKPDTAKAILQKADEQAAVAILKTFNKGVSQKDIKSLLVPELFSDQEWTPFWKSLKKVFYENNKFEYKNKLYNFNTKGSSYADDLFSQFLKTRDLFMKVKIIDIYLSNYTSTDSDIFKKILHNLEQLIDMNETNTIIILAALKYIITHYNVKLKTDIDACIKQYLNKHNYVEGFEMLKSSAHKNNFIETVYKLEKKNYPEILKNIFLSPSIQSKTYIFSILMHNNCQEQIQTIINTIINNRKEYTDHYLLIVKNYFIDQPEASTLDQYTTYMNLIEILENCYKELSVNKSAASARRQYNTVVNLLFERENFFNFLRSLKSAEMKNKIFSHLNNMHFLENYIKTEIKELTTKLTN